MQANFTAWRGSCYRSPYPDLLLPVNGAEAKPDKKKSQAAYQTGARADQAGQRDEAIAAYTEAIQADPANAAAWCARGKDYFAAGDREKAAADFDQAIRSQPGDPLCYAARGEFFALPPAGARRAGFHYRHQPETGTHRDLHRRAASPIWPCKHYDKAIDDFTQAIKLRLDNPEPYKGRGMARSALGKYRDAIEDFDLALARKPDYEDAFVERALAYTGSPISRTPSRI